MNVSKERDAVIIHEVIVYTEGGLVIAQYPKELKLQMLSGFLSAIRHFSIANSYSEIQQIIWMKKKATFLYSRQREIMFAMITSRESNDETIKRFISHIRDRFLISLTAEENFVVIKVGRHDELIKRIVDEEVDDYNDRSGMPSMRIVT